MTHYRFAVIATLVGCATTSIATGQTVSCSPNSEWTAPRPLRAGGDLFTINRVSGAALSGGTLLLGSPALIWRVNERPWRGEPVAGVIVQADGSVRVISLPPATSARWLAPLAIARRDGAVDVLWGTHADSSSLSPFIATTLWYARFDRTGWSAPQRIADADAIWWDGSTNSAIADGDDLHVITRAFDSAHTAQPWTGALYLRRSHGVWSVRPINPPDFFPRYTALVAGHAHHLAFFYSGKVRDGAGLERNGLASIESDDGGATWKAPSIVRHLSGNNGYWLQATRDDSTVSLVFATVAESDTGAGRVSRLVSTDGIHWRNGTDVDVRGVITGFVAVPTPRAPTVVLAFRDRRLESTTWDGAAWQPPARLSSGFVGTVSFVAGSQEHGFLAWNETLDTDEPNEPRGLPVLMISERRACRGRLSSTDSR